MPSDVPRANKQHGPIDFLQDAGCHTPVGVFSSLTDGHLHLQARVFPEAGGPPQTGAVSGPADDPHAVALELFNSLT